MQKGAFDWGIVGVDLDDIEVPLNNPNDTRAHRDRDLRALKMPSESDSSSIYLSPVDPSNESPSIFERFPEALVHEKPDDLESRLVHEASDSASDFCQLLQPLAVDKNQLPYSWMVQNPGQIPEILCSNSPRPAYTKPKAGSKSPGNVDGETQMEVELKRGAQNPYEYFFRATAFTCIMDLNSEGL